MRDLISRQAAIDAVNTIFAVTPTQKDVVMDCIEAIVAVPSANETKISSIFEFDSVVYDEDVDMWFINCTCTACNQKIVKMIKKSKATIEFEYSFCPLCGAKIVKKGVV